jgi:hypothetical protein
VSFTASYGGDGWILSEAEVSCTAAFPDKTHLDLTECGGDVGDLHFERQADAE